MIEILFLLTIKHFIADAVLQNSYQYSNKGEFLHPGGLLHIFIHGVGTILCFNGYNLETLLIVSWIDMILHYTIDYIKMNVSDGFKFSEYVDTDGKSYLKINSNKFFILLVFDQCLHFATYIGLVYIVFENKIPIIVSYIPWIKYVI